MWKWFKRVICIKNSAYYKRDEYINYIFKNCLFKA